MSSSSKTNTSESASNSSSNGSSNSKSSGKGNMTEQKEGQGASLQMLLQKGLKEIYNAEKQLLKALPEMAEACDDEELQAAFLDHADQTKKQVERLEKVFSRLRIDRAEERCIAMEALIEEGRKVIRETEEGPVRDAALIIAGQKVEHHEIAAYGSLVELAEVLGYHKIADILDRTLEEEELTDSLLTEIAKDINEDAREMSEELMESYA